MSQNGLEFLLGEHAFGWMWICHGPHFGHHDSIGFRVAVVSVTSEIFASVCNLSCKKEFSRNSRQANLQKKKSNFYTLGPSIHSKATLRDEVITLFDCEIVQEGHSIKPVVKRSLSKWEETWAISHKGALQPLRKRACIKHQHVCLLRWLWREKQDKAKILQILYMLTNSCTKGL